MSGNNPDVHNSSSGNVAFEIDAGTPVKAPKAHVKKLEQRMKSYGSRPKTPKMIEEKLESAEERRKEQQAQRLERMKAREADCLRANEAMGMVPPRTWGKKVVGKSLDALQKNYKEIEFLDDTKN